VKKGITGSPLSKLLRQLRISHDSLELSEQKSSKILLHQLVVRFNNDFSLLESEIARLFPQAMDRFKKLVEMVKNYNPFTSTSEYISARNILSQTLENRALEDILLLPTSYYGSAKENDMDWRQFVIMFRSIFLEGFARPFDGIKKILQLLITKFNELGGEKKLRCAVKKIETKNGKASGVVLDDDRVIEADHIISTIGHAETMKLCQGIGSNDNKAGKLSFCEAIAVFDGQPSDFGWDETIIFFDEKDHFSYQTPSTMADASSGVICLPNNYNYQNGLKLNEGMLRVTSLASYDAWKAAPINDYHKNKSKYFNTLIDKALSILTMGREIFDLSSFRKKILDTDFFTPLTIERFTGHQNGAIYGSPNKIYSGLLPVENLYLCGTDQGFLGIVGAMLSGVSIVNSHILSKS
jgi:phytoene dehydrogenase-like protein